MPTKKPTARVMNEQPVMSKQQMIAALNQSTHRDFMAYAPVVTFGVKDDPVFLAHLIAWNEKNGAIRDSKMALPVLSLLQGIETGELRENSLAHVGLLDPRNLVRACDLYLGQRTSSSVGFNTLVKQVIEPYLRIREENWGWWERTALQHRRSLQRLYSLAHVKPNATADLILFKGQPPRGTVFHALTLLRHADPSEAAGIIMSERIPFLPALGYLGKKAVDPAVVMALIKSMSSTELVSNTAMLERLGIKTKPELRAAYEEGLKRVVDTAKGKQKQVLKTSKAIAAVQDEGLKKKLEAVQEKQLDKLSNVDGNWLVLGDKSGSMSECIEKAVELAATLARMVKGRVHLVFFDVQPLYVEVTGKTLAEIKQHCRHVRANGGTSIGVGLHYLMVKGIDVDGIAVVSDGEENAVPYFPAVYNAYCSKFGKEPPVYFYKMAYGQTILEQMMEHQALQLQVFDVTRMDYNSLPNVVQSMRTNRYSLVDQIMESPLLTLAEVFKRKEVAV